MKNILFITAFFLFIGCSTENSKDGALVSVKKIPEITVNDYIYTLGEVTIKWIAFKHSAKAQVGGKFKSAEVKGFTESTKLSTAISGVRFKIPVASTSTNDEVRDYKIVNSFFNTMVDTDSISGRILSIDENGSGKLVIIMNGQEVEKQYKWEMDQTTKEIYLKTSIDVLNWGAQSSLDALNEVCLEQHTGPDGQNVLWPNVDITVIVDL
tara:strand:- start:947 stop:1576 length:630 start_codon:yes stop_codon:yes gene_type:complete